MQRKALHKGGGKGYITCKEKHYIKVGGKATSLAKKSTT